MRISQKLDYACRAMAQLAKRHDGRTITRLDELAQREAVSANFLVQILNDLRRAGLIESRRGKSGGYLLSRKPDSINLREIVDAVEPSLLSFSTHTEGESGGSVRSTWENISQELRNHLERTPLTQLAERSEAPMFYI
ncbi:MAG: Rrf2 family transcriptional regulator [Verrucomicrobia bacterium]|nr:MAG: Rrf2 family transcriptional regulator [Verrucomicrobiota bacterium]TAE87703.1 MAG: Rrf2 family transcriptional regulator [Verrucomicrobiota bacterium]TAF25363.1 MAG: Rrf2 family transcriptional regulator [Verrucomicrobiota bacterium]TAF41150.1 MAG: Rrf2 family transcriptional regulator [Verrucomicrobiota bacterium]